MSFESKEPYEVKDAEVVHVTKKALLVKAPEFEKALWVPQSQITDDSEVYKAGTTGTLIVTGWFAEQAGLV